MNPDASPQLLEANWKNDRIADLFDDLQQGAALEHIQVRTTSAANSEERSVTLPEARELFQSGEATAIQIRYEFDSQIWCDTLMVGPESTRIIRTRLDQRTA